MSEATHEEIGRAWSRMKKCQDAVASLEESVEAMMGKIPDSLHASSTSVREEHGELLIVRKRQNRTGVEYVEKYPSYKELARAVEELQSARKELEDATLLWKERSA